MAQLTETDFSVFILVAIIVAFMIVCMFFLGYKWIALIFLSIGVSFIVAYILIVTQVKEDQGSTCHYDLYDEIGCPDPNAYCTDNFETNYSDCMAWCYYDCPNNYYYPLGSNPGTCNEETKRCDNNQPCTFPNLTQPICLTVVCDGELTEYFDGKLDNISEDCRKYCSGNPTPKCLQYYCSIQLEFDEAPTCEEYCALPEYQQDPICITYFCSSPDAEYNECVCYQDEGVHDPKCAAYCKEDNNVDNVPICLEWLCNVEDPTNARCLMPCTDFNNNLLSCEWIQFHNQEVYIQSVYNQQFVVTNVDSPIWQLTTLPKDGYENRLPDIFRFFEDDAGYALFYFADEYSSNEMYGNQYFQIVNERKGNNISVKYNRFVLESTGIANIFYIKTYDLFQTGGNESLKPKYITLGCKGLVLEFYNSIREKQQWVIQKYRNTYN
jgi:hypothetical protein